MVPDLACVAMLGVLVGSRLRNPDQVDLIAIAIGVWILITGLVNATVTHTMDFSHFVGYTVRLASYWFALPLLRRLPSKQWTCVLVAGVIIAVFVSVLHTYIEATTNVPLLLNLYYAWHSADGSVDPQMQYLVATRPNEFIRAWPDGITLVTSVYVACLAVLASGKKIGPTYAWIALAAICGTAALITLTRSLGIVMLIAMPILAIIRYRSPVGSARIFALLMTLALGFGTVAVLSEHDLTAEYLDRFGQLDEELDPLSSPRLLDTAQGTREVLESPIFGTGLIDPRDFRSDVGKDTHGLVSLGLLGGVPLVILTLIATYYSLTIGLRSSTWHATAGVFIVLQVVLLMAINTFPGFVWIRSMVPAVIGMAMCAPIGSSAGVRTRGRNSL